MKGECAWYVCMSRNKNKVKTDLSSISESELVTKSQVKLEEALTPAVSGKSVTRLPGEKDLNLVAKLTGIELVLSDSHGNLLEADVKGLYHYWLVCVTLTLAYVLQVLRAEWS